MGKTHGNCGKWKQESANHVFCDACGNGCWYSKGGNASRCRDWTARIEEIKTQMSELEADYYSDDTKFERPIMVVAHCANGKRYGVQPSHIMQARMAKWSNSVYRYEENGIGYVKTIWSGPLLNITVVSDSEV